MSDDKNFQLDVVTPNKVIVSKKVKAVTLPGEVGSFQVLYNHAALLSNLIIGMIKIENVDDSVEYFATSGGFAEVVNNRVTVLADTVEKSAEIDVKRAEAALERAQKRLAEKVKDLDYERALLAMERAKNRLRIANR